MAEKKLTRAEKRAINKANYAAGRPPPVSRKAKKQPALPDPKGSAVILAPTSVHSPGAAPGAVLSGIPTESFEPPEGTPPDDRPADPAWVASTAQRDLVKVYRAIGVTVEGIARQVQVSPATLELHCREELDHGAEHVLAMVGAKAIQAALRGDGRMLGHVTKHFLGWGASKPRPPVGFEAEVSVEAQAGAKAGAKGLTATESNALAEGYAGGKVRVTLKLSEHITVKEG